MKTDDSFSKPQVSLFKPIQLVAKVSSRISLGDRPLDRFRVIIFVIFVVVFLFIILEISSFWLYELMTKSFSLPASFFHRCRITLSLAVLLAPRLDGSSQSERRIVMIALLSALGPNLCLRSLTITRTRFFPHSRASISLEAILAPCLLLKFSLLDRPTIAIFLFLMLEPSVFLLGLTLNSARLLPVFPYPGGIKAYRFRTISCLLSTFPLGDSIRTSLSMIWASSFDKDSISAPLPFVISSGFEGA